jgi:hypothetical protein
MPFWKKKKNQFKKAPKRRHLANLKREKEKEKKLTF